MTRKLMTAGLLAAAATSAALAQPAPPAGGMGWGQGARPAETRAQVVARTQAMFQRLDRNRNGALTQDELADLGQRGPGGPGTPPPSPPPPGAGRDAGADRDEAMFGMMDLNHDGVITRDEFNQAHARMAAGHAMGPTAGMSAPGAMPDAAGGPGVGERGMPGERGMRAGMLMMADTNRDGRITLQEMTAAALARFDRMDLNRDGTVTPEERAQARGQRGEGRRG